MRNSSKPMLLLAILIAFNLPAQADKFKVGKVSKKELKMETYEPYPDADAVILRDEGRVNFQASAHGSIQVVLERHVRIKILSKEGYDQGDFKIPLYDYDQRKDYISGFKAYTFNLENGKVVDEKLKKKDIQYEDASKFWNMARFSMPKVKVGSVIDVSYRLNHPFSFAIDDWYFQYDIPVMHSEFEVKIPEWLQFNRKMYGYEEVKSFPLEYENQMIHSRGNRVDVTAEVHKFVAESIPPFITEPYMTTKENFISKVTYELLSTNFPGSVVEYYTKNWGDVSKQLLDHPEFGQQINRGHLRTEAKEIMAKTNDPMERLSMAVDRIQSLIKYNGSDGILPYYSTLKMSVNENSGNSADINLNLIALLRQMDIDARPVALSTRSHGYIHPTAASLNDLNYVLTLVKVKDQSFMVDATDPYLPLGYVPFKCLNGKGILLDEENPRMLNIGGHVKNDRRSVIMMNFTEDSITGMLKNTYSGYTSSSQWKDYSEKGEEKYASDMAENYPGWTFSDFEIDWQEGNTLDERMTFKKVLTEESMGGMIYLNAMYGNYVDENPFKLEERKYPVNFGCPIIRNYQVILKLPEGFKVESVPENALVELPEGGGAFKYVTSIVGDQLVISSSMNINKTFYNHLEYSMIKQLYQYVADKYNEKIVIKKM